MDPTATQPILVVEDENDLRRVMQLALEDDGHRVVTAVNGSEALQCIAGQRPSLVLTDLSMPVMGGVQLHRGLRTLGLDVPVVFVSAGPMVRVEAARCGVAGYLCKPFELDQLLELVARLLRERAVHV